MDRSQQEQIQHQRMIQTPISKLIPTLAVPTVISMLVTSIYNMADTFFVSRLGTSATGAVGIVFSLMAIIQAVGFMLGMGSGSLVSRLLGQREYEQANTTASSGFFTAIAFGLLLTFFGLLFMDPLMRILGATPTILPYARSYARYILFGAAIMCSSFVLNNVLRSEGKAMLAMVGIGLGGVLNIVLDPIFIFVLDFGIAGAAIATLISQCVSFGVLLSCFLLGKSSIELRFRHISRKVDVYLKIMKTGFPSFARQGLASIATVALNTSAAVYGDPAVAAMSVVGRIFMFIFSAMLGFGQGFQPVVGYNYGAKRYDRVREATWFTVKVGVVLMVILATAGFYFAPQAMRIFRPDDQQVIAIGTLAFRAQCISLPLFSISTVTNMLLQATGRSGKATFVSACRQGIYFLPLIAILPHTIGLLGVQITQALSDLLTFCTALPLLILFMKELRAMENEEKNTGLTA